MGIHRHKRTGRWVAQRWDADLGRNVQVGTFATKGPCKEPAADGRCCGVHALRAHEGKQATSRITVAEWRQQWLKNPRWKGSTRVHYEERTRAFSAAHGDRPLTSIDRAIARRWVGEHPATNAALSALFGAAMYEDNEHGDPLLTANPFSKLVRRTVAKRDLRADWLSDEDVSQLEHHARRSHGEVIGDTLACMVRFAAETGIRPGELYVLEEADLDAANGILRVRRSYDSKTGALGEPKNGEQREVVLSARAAAAAAAAPRYEGAVTRMPLLGPRGEKLRGDEFWLPRGTPRLFSQRTGVQWRAPAFSVHWDPVRKAAGRAGMDFYELRHFCATRLLELGLRDDEVAVQLGHTDGGELVRTTYGHPNNRRALDRVREALDGGMEEAA